MNPASTPCKKDSLPDPSKKALEQDIFLQSSRHPRSPVPSADISALLHLGDALKTCLAVPDQIAIYRRLGVMIAWWWDDSG
jgi:hypothetical protein